MATQTKNGRIDLRLTAEQKRTIEQAAALSGRTVTDFSVTALMHEAQQVVKFERSLRVDQETWDAFSEIVDRPARGVDGLAELVRRPSVFTD